MMLVVHNNEDGKSDGNGLSHSDLSQLALYMNKKSENMEFAEMKLDIIGINLTNQQIASIPTLFSKSLSSKFISEIKSVNLELNQNHFS
jgi:hypothetical protein